ncbi:hypothetical protein [Pyrobaculum sp.]|uniref:hypothetical protein n=1 Tax=Pyrobaculum sp. TaxID=2004705 RepID=UPI003163C8D4
MEEIGRRWREYEERLRQAFNEFWWLRGALEELKNALGGFEYFKAWVISALLREGGAECTVHVDVTLPVDGFEEVDLFCPEPLVVGVVSA